MANKGKVGRRPRFGSRMPSTAITASVEELTFLMLMSGGNVSQGIQKSIGQLATADEDAERMMRQARWMTARAAEALGGEVTQKELYSYITNNYWELAAEFEARS